MRRSSRRRSVATLRGSIVLLVLLSGCALAYPPKGPKHYKPDTIHPSMERIRALAEIAAPINPKESAFDLRLTPAVVLAGGDVIVTCYVPQSWPKGRIAVSVAGLMASDRPLDRVENRYRVERIPCGTWPVSCVAYTSTSTKRIDRELESRGDCQP